MQINKIYTGDCLEIMRDWPDNCVDLVLTDPPYGIGRDDWDGDIPEQEYFDEIFRISTKQMIFGGNYFNLSHSQGWICWDKKFAEDIRQKTLTQIGIPRENISDFELIWTSFLKKSRIIRYTYIGNLKGFNNDLAVDYRQEKKMHITQKPIELVKKLLLDYAPETNLILDPFCGSGTTCVAAKMLGRNYIGIDISEEYCNIARMRLKAVETGVPVKEQKIGQMGLYE